MIRSRRLPAAAVLAAAVLLLTAGVGAAQGGAGRVRAAGPLTDISVRSGNEDENAVAIQLTSPKHVTAVSNLGSGTGLFHTWTADGTTWQHDVIATGTDIPAACCDPTLTSDSYGNIFLAYLASNLATVLVVSTDGGATFHALHTFSVPSTRGSAFPTRMDAPLVTRNTDQPTVAAGKGEVWVVFTLSTGRIEAGGAPVTGLGQVGAFATPELAPDTSCSTGCDYGDVAIGPGGEVMAAWQQPSSGQHSASLYVALDPDGLGPDPFGAARLVATSNVGGFDYIPAQMERSVDAEFGLAWDRGRTHRLYAMWNQETPDESNNLDVLVAHSDDSGATWSTPVKVNDDATTSSQFLPKIAVDQATGEVAVSWYDCRSDTGQGPPFDSDGVANTDAVRYLAVSGNGGQSFSKNVPLGIMAANAARSGDSIDFGDFEGLAFFNHAIWPVWSDNTNSTGGNPNGTLHQLDLYTERISA